MCGFLVVSEDCEEKKFEKALATLVHRGPDNTTIKSLEQSGKIGFQRLAIMDLSHDGDQPFCSKELGIDLVCNGEIYNHRQIKTDYLDRYQFQSQSDCEVLIPLFHEYGIEELCDVVDGEFALCFFDHQSKEFVAARDPMGIRPLFYGYTKEGSICFASEVKALLEFCDEIKPFPPGHYYKSGEFKCFLDYANTEVVLNRTEEEILEGIHHRLVDGVKKRLDSDAPIGFLLSGGLDSSLVCAIAARHSEKPIKTFSVGITDNPIDTKYAKVVADFLGTDHHEYLFTKDQVFESLSELIYQLETWDITTIRASLGMYLICKYIKETTDIKVLLTGEVSDEIFGYKYTDFAPTPEEFQKEAIKRVRELYQYDVLRADRCISANSLEARVPFSDKDFVSFVMSIDPKIKMNSTGVGKYLLRKAFEGKNYLPEDILYREKAAFSDAVGHSMVDWLKEFAEEKYTGEDFKELSSKYKHGTPFTKESLLYREIFESHFSGKANLIDDFWMPNKEWENCDVADPSARVLPNYGKSGK